MFLNQRSFFNEDSMGRNSHISFPGNIKNEGWVKNARLEENGVLEWAGRFKYEGGLKGGKPNGYGTMTY